MDLNLIGKLHNAKLLKHLNLTFSATSLMEGSREQWLYSNRLNSLLNVFKNADLVKIRLN